MEILTVLEKKMKKTAMRLNVKIGNSIVEKGNVFSNLGDAMAKKIVPQVICLDCFSQIHTIQLLNCGLEPLQNTVLIRKSAPSFRDCELENL